MEVLNLLPTQAPLLVKRPDPPIEVNPIPNELSLNSTPINSSRRNSAKLQQNRQKTIRQPTDHPSFLILRNSQVHSKKEPSIAVISNSWQYLTLYKNSFVRYNPSFITTQLLGFVVEMIPRIILDVFLQLKHDDMFISSFIHKAEILSHSSSQIVSFLMLLRICSACFMIMIPQMIALSLSSLSSALFTLSQPHRSPKHRLQLRILLPHRRSPFRLKHSPALRYISFCWEYFFDLVSTLLQCVSDLLLALYQINFFVVDTLLVAIFR